LPSRYATSSRRQGAPARRVVVVGEHDLRALQPRDLPCLGRRRHGHRVPSRDRCDARVRHVTVPGVDERRVNLVGDDARAVPLDDLGQRCELFVVEHAPGQVVGAQSRTAPSPAAIASRSSVGRPASSTRGVSTTLRAPRPMISKNGGYAGVGTTTPATGRYEPVERAGDPFQDVCHEHDPSRRVEARSLTDDRFRARRAGVPLSRPRPDRVPSRGSCRPRRQGRRRWCPCQGGRDRP